MCNPDARLVILDRDGVINRDSADYIKCADEWLPLAGSCEAIAALCNHGFRVVVASNQSGVGRGLFTEDALALIHKKMRACITASGGELTDVFYCPHRPDEHCDCRKPKPGLLRQIETKLATSLVDVPVIGDSLRDLEAAQAVNARAILVRTGNGSRTAKSLGSKSNIEIFDDLAGAARALIAESG